MGGRRGEAHRIKGNLRTQAQKQPGNVSAAGEIGSSNFLMLSFVFSFLLWVIPLKSESTMGETSGQGILIYIPIKVINQARESVSQKNVKELLMKGDDNGQSRRWVTRKLPTTNNFKRPFVPLCLYVIICIDQLEIHLWRIKETQPRKVKVEASAREMAYSRYWSIFPPDCFTLDPPSPPGRMQFAVSRPWVSEEYLSLESHYTLTLSWLSFAFIDKPPLIHMG